MVGMSTTIFIRSCLDRNPRSAILECDAGKRLLASITADTNSYNRSFATIAVGANSCSRHASSQTTSNRFEEAAANELEFEDFYHFGDFGTCA